ncbi:MAG: HAD family hydrolase [Lautropia sp.]|nr:HAD family hydrolase [Lautropia sp.]
MKRIALFDLDHTLLPIDSDNEWGRFLSRTGRIADPAAFSAQVDAFFEQYKAGQLDPVEHLRFVLSAFANRPAAEIEAWRQEYIDTVIRPVLHPDAQALVQKHLAAGDLCAIVTATNSFVTAPIATLFGVEHLLGAEGEQHEGVYTGNPKPGVTITFQGGKLVRIQEWLAEQGLDLDHFDEIWAYSDSRNDLPMLTRATHPVAVNPDTTLRQIAHERAWPIIDLFHLT